MATLRRFKASGPHGIHDPVVTATVGSITSQSIPGYTQSTSGGCSILLSVDSASGTQLYWHNRRNNNTCRFDYRERRSLLGCGFVPLCNILNRYRKQHIATRTHLVAKLLRVRMNSVIITEMADPQTRQDILAVRYVTATDQTI
jgi:hypothetical protein